MADRFLKGIAYSLNESMRSLFYYNTFSNPSIIREIEEHGGSFTVLTVDEHSGPTSVLFADGLYHEIRGDNVGASMMFYLFSDEAKYFDALGEVPPSWESGRSYKCISPEALLKCSDMNMRFLDMVGSNAFELLSVMISSDGHSRTGKIRFSDQGTGEPVEITFALTHAERLFFTEVKPEANIPEFSVQSEYEQPIECDNDSKDFKPTVVDGTIKFEVDDEHTRLEAIKFLNSLKFEK